MLTAGEPFDALQKSTQQLDQRWEKLQRLMADTQIQVDLNMETKKFYDELHGLQELMGSYEKWVGTAENIAEEAVEITKQLEQCRVGICVSPLSPREVGSVLHIRMWQ